MKDTVVNGVRHAIVPANTLDCAKAERKIANTHPLGDVYVLGDHGYVQSGYDWLRFPVEQLNVIRLREKYRKTVNPENGNESFRYTILDADEPDLEHQANIHLTRLNSGSILVNLNIPAEANIGTQQLGELGWLLVALAECDTADELDIESVGELLDGYGISSPPQALLRE